MKKIKVRINCYSTRRLGTCGARGEGGKLKKSSCCIKCKNYLKCMKLAKTNKGIDKIISKICHYKQWCSIALIQVPQSVNKLDQILIKAGKLKIKYVK